MIAGLLLKASLTGVHSLLWPVSVCLLQKDGFPVFQVEAELGYPGGRAKIIHKESDMILAFAVNKVRPSEAATTIVALTFGLTEGL